MGASYKSHAIKLPKLKMPNLFSSCRIVNNSPQTSKVTKSVSTSTSTDDKTSIFPKIKNPFSSSSKKEKPTYTVLDYIRGKKITTEMYTQTDSPKYRDVGTQYDPPSPPQTLKKQDKTGILNIFSKKKPDLSKETTTKEPNPTAKITTYSHEYRQLERNQIDLIKKHQEALQKTLTEYIKLLSPDGDDSAPSTSASTSNNLKNNQLNLQERNLKISELNEKIKDMKQIGSDIKNVSTVLASIEPLKREVREENLLKEVSSQGTVIYALTNNTPKKKQMKLKHLNN